MKKSLAFVLSGGGARGAMQVGALRALLEAGYQPDWLIGTSIGAANCAYLALHGVSLQSLDELAEVWRDVVAARLMPDNYLWLTVRALLRRRSNYTIHLRDFFIRHGLSPDLRFHDIKGVGLLLVAADLNNGGLVVYGLNPDDSLLEGVMASTALPPWMRPLEIDGPDGGQKLLVDGGVISNLPIETALSVGVSEIIALDVHDPRAMLVDAQGLGVYLNKLVSAVQERQVDLELALALSLGVRVRYVHLMAPEPVALWGFDQWEELIECGYDITRREIARWQAEKKPWWKLSKS
jgi:NTE family protein